MILGENEAKQSFLAACQMVTLRLRRKTGIYFEELQGGYVMQKKSGV